MHALSKLLLTASLFQLTPSVSADEWPADPVDTTSAHSQMVTTNSGTKPEKALVGELISSTNHDLAATEAQPAQPAAVNDPAEKLEVLSAKDVDTSKLPRKPEPKKHFRATTKQSPPTRSSKHASFGNAMSAQANKMATTENPYKKNSSAAVIAERRGDLAAQRSQSHPHR